MPKPRPRKQAGLELTQRERNKLDKRERIRKAALTAFVRDGFDETSIEAVAREAGVAKGTIFLYAEDKRDLLCLVMHDLLDDTLRRQLATLGRHADLVDQLMHMFGGLFRMYAAHPGLARGFVGAFPGATGLNGRQIHLITLSFQGQLGELLRLGIERGSVRKDAPIALAASSVFALYFSALMAWVSGFVSQDQALEALLRPSLELLLRGLQPR